MISLLHPSRSRIDKSRDTMNKWISKATQKIELIVSVDEDDPQLELYLGDYATKFNVIQSKNRSAVDAINKAAEVSTGDILIVVSDDTDCPNDWVNKILTAVQGRQDYVLKVGDGIQNWLCTMPVIDRKYYERFGYIYYPEYSHMFCDTEFTHVADCLGKIIQRNDLRFPHEHYCVGKAKKDHINERADATWKQGMQLYLKRVRERFGLDPSIDVFNLSAGADSHLKWLKQNL